MSRKRIYLGTPAAACEFPRLPALVEYRYANQKFFIMTKPRWQLRDALGLSLIGVAELLIFFRHPGHFFMGDTIFWMGTRYHSVHEFLSGFFQLDPFDWYRPLSQRTVESLLYPLAGLNPTPYHLAIFVLFFLCTISVFVLADTLTQRRTAAWIATLFFAPQITHAVTTSDTAFAPEFIFTLFCVGSAVAYIRYLRTQNYRMLLVSTASFVGALLSKETAMTLPFALTAICLLLPQGNLSRLRSLLPHFVILAAYLVFVVGFLHLRGIHVRQLVESPGTVQGGTYELSLGRNVLETTGHAFSWAFSIPRGEFGQWRPIAPVHLPRLMITALKTVRVFICAASLLVLFTPQRRLLLIGLSWFLLLAAPTLPIVNHFFPYYMFAPLVGFSMAVGVVLDWVFQRISQFSPRLAFAVCGAIILIPAVVDANMAVGIADNYFLAGGSQKLAFNQLSDLRTLHPSLPPGTRLLIFDEENSGTSWNHGKGRLFQMAYGDQSLNAEYVTDGPISITRDQIDNGRALAFKLINGRLAEITSFVRQRPDLLLPHTPDENYRLEVGQTEVRPGDEYSIRIPQLNGATVNILRAFDGVMEEPFTVTLDSTGEARIKVPGETKPGTITFVGVKRAESPGWCTVLASIRIQNKTSAP